MALASVLAQKKHVLTSEEQAQATALEQELFGQSAGLLQREVGNAFETATTETDTTVEPDKEEHAQGLAVSKPKRNDLGKKRGRVPVWVDPDTDVMQVNIKDEPKLRKLRRDEAEAHVSGTDYEDRLRSFHSKLNKRTAWAKRRTSQAPTGEEALATAAFTKKLTSLQRETAGQAGRLELTRMRDANIRGRSQAVVQSVEWHPNAQLLMTAGFDKRLRLFNVDGVHNTAVQTVYIQDMPVHRAVFTRAGRCVVAAGRRKFFYVWDLESQRLERIQGILGFDSPSLGSFVAPPAAMSEDSKACIAFLGSEGSVGLVSMLSRQLVGSFKMNGDVCSAAFDPSGTELYTSGSDGRVCVWDVRTQRCLHSFVDQGCLRSTSLARSDAALAAGSSSGVVNVYKSWRDGGLGNGSTAPQPLRAFGNLVTEVDTLSFSPDGSMLCMASHTKKDAMRLVHMPSLTVYSNWPTSKSPLGHVHCASFSPGGGLLAVGNAKGHVLTYRLHDFPEV